MTLNKMISLLTALVLLLCMGTAVAQEEKPISFDVTDYISSIADLDLSPYRGKVMALFFYTCNSDEAKATLPVWKRIHDDFDPQDVEIILVHAWENEGQKESDAIRERFQLDGMNIYEDQNCTLCHTLGLTSYPNVLLLDAQGSPCSGYSGQLSYQTIADALIALNVTQLHNASPAPAQ